MNFDSSPLKPAVIFFYVYSKQAQFYCCWKYKTQQFLHSNSPVDYEVFTAANI